MRSSRSSGRSDPAFVAKLVERNGLALGHAAEPLRADRDIVLRAARSRGGSLACAPADGQRAQRQAEPRFASPALRADRALVEAACGQDGRLASLRKCSRH